MRRIGRMSGWIGACLLGVPACPARQGVRVFVDPPGDAVVRRTDIGNSGPLNPGCVLPDLVQVRLSGWLPGGPDDPYSGSVVPGNQADIFRLDVVFNGLLNPPGPLGLNGQAYDPFRFGPSPVYGFLELDVDNNKDTGGELDGATLRYLANIGRFGGVPFDGTAGRAARSADDYSLDFYSPPQFRRSGEDFALALCGCWPVTLISSDDDTWIVKSRYFQRAGGYQEASGMFGGSDRGLYDPLVNIRFRQCAGTNTTTVTLVYALTMHGAALLAGQQTDQPIDPFIDIHGSLGSVVEALSDIIEGAEGNLVGEVWDLTHLWSHRNPYNYLDPTQWAVTALFGTAYAVPQADGALYVWTDTGFSQVVGDFDGDGAADGADRSALAAYIDAHDGDDGTIDSVVHIPNFSKNFSPYDTNGDGLIDSHDLSIYPALCLSDWNRDDQVNTLDFFQFLVDFFAGHGDFNHDGVTDSLDFFGFITAFFSGC